LPPESERQGHAAAAKNFSLRFTTQGERFARPSAPQKLIGVIYNLFTPHAQNDPE
jgi:hypothetical protein